MVIDKCHALMIFEKLKENHLGIPSRRKHEAFTTGRANQTTDHDMISEVDGIVNPRQFLDFHLWFILTNSYESLWSRLRKRKSSWLCDQMQKTNIKIMGKRGCQEAALGPQELAKWNC
jgi:hypothetical protein